MAEQNILSVSLSDYQSQIDALRGSLANLERGSVEYAKVVTQLDSKTQAFDRALSSAKTMADTTGKSFNSLSADLSRMQEAWKAAETEVERTQIKSKVDEIQASINNMIGTTSASKASFTDYTNQVRAAFSAIGGSMEGTFVTLTSLQTTLPALGQGFLDVGQKIKMMAVGNPILLAITVAIGAIVAICNKFKSAVSKNADLQKRWNANMAAFKPILNAIDKVFDMLATAIMDAVDWMMDHLPDLFSFLKKGAVWIIDGIEMVVEVVEFLPKTINKAMANIIQIIGKAATKIGDGLESIFSFFGMDDTAKKIKDAMSNLGDNITAFGENYEKNLESAEQKQKEFFQSLRDGVSESIDNFGKQMTASRENAKAQQENAKQLKSVEEDLTKNAKYNNELREKIKNTADKNEKERLRNQLKEHNKYLAQREIQIKKEAYLLKKAELDKKGILNAADKAELQRLKLDYLKAGTETLGRNVELTPEQTLNVSSSTTHKAVKAGKATGEALKTGIEMVLGSHLSKMEELPKKISVELSGTLDNIYSIKKINAGRATDFNNIYRLYKIANRNAARIDLNAGTISSGVQTFDDISRGQTDGSGVPGKVYRGVLETFLEDKITFDGEAGKEAYERYKQWLNNVTVPSQSDLKQLIYENGKKGVELLKDAFETVIPAVSRDKMEKQPFFNRILSQFFDPETGFLQFEDAIKKMQTMVEKHVKTGEFEPERLTTFRKAAELSTAYWGQIIGGFNEKLPQYYNYILDQIKTDDPELKRKMEEARTLSDNVGSIVSNMQSSIDEAISEAEQKGNLTKILYMLYPDKNRDELLQMQQQLKEAGEGAVMSFIDGFKNKVNDSTFLNQTALVLTNALANKTTEVLATAEKVITGKIQKINKETQNYLTEIDSETTDFEKKRDETKMTSLRNTNSILKPYKLNYIQEHNDDAEYLLQAKNYQNRITLFKQQIEQLKQLRDQYKEDGNNLGYEKTNEEITNKNIELQKLEYEETKFYLNKELQEIEKAAKKRQRVTNSVLTCFSNIGSALSTYGSLQQDIIQQEIDSGKISEEEGKKRFESAKKMQVASAIISALGNVVSQTASIWNPKSGLRVWEQIALTATLVPATLASLMAQINQMKSTSLNSSSTGGASTASISSVAVTPILDENQDMNTIQAINGVSKSVADQKVYILESDIQKSNKRVAVREANSTF